MVHLGGLANAALLLPCNLLNKVQVKLFQMNISYEASPQSLREAFISG